MQSQRTLNLHICRQRGVSEHFLQLWRDGIHLEGHERAEAFFLEDYNSVKYGADRAAEEVDRLTEEGKIFWFAPDEVPDDLDVCPTTLIVRNSRMRVVHDWTRAGLNEHLAIPDITFDTVDSWVNVLRPGCFMAGLDIKDCFLHWPIHRDSRHRLGIRHPWTHALGVYLFLPPGLAPAPGINEQHVQEVVRVASLHVPIIIRRFVDDLRLLNDSNLSPDDDERLLNLRLDTLKANLEELGVQVHSKAGKLIRATQDIEWLGWSISTRTMRIELTREKAAKGFALCLETLQSAQRGEQVRAKHIMTVAGFLNFVASVMKVGRPYIRSLLQGVGEAQVFSAWQAGRKKFNPLVRLSKHALTDLTWWCTLLAGPVQRPLHTAGGRVFLWHRKNPEIDALQKLAWDAGLIVVLATDASGDQGWGIVHGNSWVQGTWDAQEQEESINYKELRVYWYALQRLREVVRNKLVYIKLDNSCAVHYVNAGTGRIDKLADLARSIRLAEAELGVESVAVHLAGDQNVTADGLSRLTLSVAQRDKHPDRALRRKLFRHVLQLIPGIDLDGMAAEDGHNSQLPNYACPSFPFWEVDFSVHTVWVFPPDDLINAVLKFIITRRRQQRVMRVVALVPERKSAPWFWMLQHFSRVCRFVAGSDLFRERAQNGIWRKLPAAKEAWVVVASFARA